MEEAKVIVDPATSKCRGYGFITFIDNEHAQKALTEMNGKVIGGRAIRTNWATKKASCALAHLFTAHLPSQMAPQASATQALQSFDVVAAQSVAFNTSVYVGNIHPTTTGCVPFLQGVLQTSL